MACYLSFTFDWYVLRESVELLEYQLKCLGCFATGIPNVGKGKEKEWGVDEAVEELTLKLYIINIVGL